jgi:hypothetical protein
MNVTDALSSTASMYMREQRWNNESSHNDQLLSTREVNDREFSSSSPRTPRNGSREGVPQGTTPSFDSPTYFTPKNIRAAAARLAQRRSLNMVDHGDTSRSTTTTSSSSSSLENRFGSRLHQHHVTHYENDLMDKKRDDDNDSLKRGEDSRSPPPTSKGRENERSGKHYWFGCGKLKKKIEKCRFSTMKMRSEISSNGYKPQVPHPDHWISNHPPTDLISCTDEQAYWHGCAKCRWELSIHEKFNDDAIKILNNNDRRDTANRTTKERRNRLYLV